MLFKPQMNSKLWPSWRQCFLQYQIVTKSNNESFEVQVRVLIYSMGAEAKQINSTFKICEGLAPTEIIFNSIIFSRNFTLKVTITHKRAECFTNVVNNQNKKNREKCTFVYCMT